MTSILLVCLNIGLGNLPMSIGCLTKHVLSVYLIVKKQQLPIGEQIVIAIS